MKREIICPHCKEEWDIDENEAYYLYDEDNDDKEIICDKCGKKFYIKIFICYRFETVKTEEELEHI